MRLVLRAKQPKWLQAALVIAAVVVVFALAAAPIRLAGADPIAAYRRYLITPLTTYTGFTEVLLASIPLLYTGLSVAVAFRAGYYNIGSEGQFLAGAIAAVWVGLTIGELPTPVALTLACIAGLVGGALWALLPALLRRAWGIDEVVTTLLLNPVALLAVQALVTGPWRNSKTGFAVSDSLHPNYSMPRLIPDSNVHIGFAIVLVIGTLLWVMMNFMPGGLRARAVGLSPTAAAFSGVDVGKVKFNAALMSGALAGLGGAVQVLGVTHQLTPHISDNYGYTGIVVATLGGLSAIGVLLVGLLLGDLTVGAQSASTSLQLPPQMGQIISAALLLAVVGFGALRTYTIVRRRARGGSP